MFPTNKSGTSRKDVIEVDCMGYEGIGPNGGLYVPREQALSFALERCGLSIANPDAPESGEVAAMIEEWYYSGNWITVKAPYGGR